MLGDNVKNIAAGSARAINREHGEPMTSAYRQRRKRRERGKSVVDQFKAFMSGARVIRRDTKQSAMFRSDPGGESWVDLASLRELPSADTWSFPRRSRWSLRTSSGWGTSTS